MLSAVAAAAKALARSPRADARSKGAPARDAGAKDDDPEVPGGGTEAEDGAECVEGVADGAAHEPNDAEGVDDDDECAEGRNAEEDVPEDDAAATGLNLILTRLPEPFGFVMTIRKMGNALSVAFNDSQTKPQELRMTTRHSADTSTRAEVSCSRSRTEVPEYCLMMQPIAD